MEGLSLVPLTLAEPGRRFTFIEGGHEECEGCPFAKLCYNLEPGTKYVVESVRAVQHPCRLHDDDKVQVVTVQPVGFESSVLKKRLRGTAVTWEPVDCGYAECANWSLCHPIGMAPGKKFAIDGEPTDLECPMDYEIQRVRFKP